MIHSIDPDLASPGGYLVAVGFRRTQAPSGGPGRNGACALWELSSHMTAQFTLLRSSGVTHDAC